jgi:hypothetical protein
MLNHCDKTLVPFARVQKTNVLCSVTFVCSEDTYKLSDVQVWRSEPNTCIYLYKKPQDLWKKVYWA